MVTGFVIEGRGKGQLVRWVASGLSCLWPMLPLGEKTSLLMCFSRCVILSFHFWSIWDFEKLLCFTINIKMYKLKFIFHSIQDNMPRTPYVFGRRNMLKRNAFKWMSQLLGFPLLPHIWQYHEVSDPLTVAPHCSCVNRICRILILRALIWELVSKQVSQLEGLRHREMRIGERTLRPKRERLQSTKRHGIAVCVQCMSY